MQADYLRTDDGKSKLTEKREKMECTAEYMLEKEKSLNCSWGRMPWHASKYSPEMELEKLELIPPKMNTDELFLWVKKNTSWSGEKAAMLATLYFIRENIPLYAYYTSGDCKRGGWENKPQYFYWFERGDPWVSSSCGGIFVKNISD